MAAKPSAAFDGQSEVLRKYKLALKKRDLFDAKVKEQRTALDSEIDKLKAEIAKF